MKFALALHRRLAWLNLPAAILVAVLQRTPVLRVATAAESAFVGSPVGQVLRNVLTAVASLGALHSLAGATQLSASVASPLRVTAGTAITPVALTVTGAQTPPASFLVSGTIPPGLSVSGLTGTGGAINASTLTLSGAPTTAGTYAMTIRAWEKINRSGDASSNFTYTVVVAAAAATIPSFTLQPVAQTIVVGANVTFNSSASGTPLPTYQWRKDGVPINGATAISLTLTNVQAVQAGAYSVVATNSAGSATSNSALLTVNAPAVVAPAFTTQPASITVGAGATAVLNSTATDAISYRWQRNGSDLAGATSANLVLSGVTAAEGGDYRAIATNSSGSKESNLATLSVSNVATTEVGRLVNLSILTTAGPGAKVLTVGAVVGPLNFAGSLPLVIRAVGPTLGSAFGLGDVLADPVLTINAAGAATPIASNDNWGGATPMRAAFSAVGAFDLPTTSLDSAALSNAGVGGYTVQVTGKNDTSGLVIAEIYDNSTARTATSPRLVNLSTLTQIDAGGSLAVGFVLRGATARTVLVRGVGPSLGTIFGLGGVMADPKLELFNNDTGAKVTENDNWGGDAQLMDANATVGAFAIADVGTKDAVLLVTLPPGAYSARVSGVGSSAGTAIVEVYELP